MKKIVFCITIMVCFGCSIFAQSNNLTSSQLAIRNSIQSYLKSEGFQPEIDDDGDIKFKRQGDTYFVKVSATDENPMYVTLSKYYQYSDKISRTKLILFNSEKSYKSCKIATPESQFIIRIEMFVNASSAFTSVFYRLLKVMDDVETAIKEYCL